MTLCKPQLGKLATSLLLVTMLVTACSPAAPASPTTAPATAAPAAKTEAVASPAAAASPATNPVASPAASPAASPVASAPVSVPEDPAIASFYRGKTVKIIVGFTPGGTYDSFARLSATYLPKYLPGSPTVIVENRPGAGTLLAANAIYNTEAKDGTVLGTIAEGTVLQQATGTPGIEFDAAKFQWLGSTGKTSSMCMIRKDSGITSIQQLISSGKEIPTSTSGRGTQAYDFPALLNVVLGTKFKLISGYTSGPETQVAFEKGEVDGFCTSATVYLLRQRPLVEGASGFASLLVHSGSGSRDTSDPALAGVPSAMEIADPLGKQALQAYNGPLQMAFPILTGPAVPAERVAALRRAFETMYKDPDFINDAHRFEPGFGPQTSNTGDEVTRLVQGILNTPAPVLDKLRESQK
jgi:tripartite-type tricarboxylate transporter receptor subunit TctC